jgi:hypothetical protein
VPRPALWQVVRSGDSALSWGGWVEDEKEMAATGIPLQRVRGGLIVTRAALGQVVRAGLSCGESVAEIRVAGIEMRIYVQLS